VCTARVTALAEAESQFACKPKLMQDQNRALSDTAAHGDKRAGNGSGFFRCQEQHHLSQIGRRDPAGEVCLGHVGTVLRRVDGRGQHRVDGNAGILKFFGKGFGDLPIGYLRPLAVTGTLGYAIADKKLKATGVDPDTGEVLFNNGIPNMWNGGLSLQYSMRYLQGQVKDLGLPEWVNRLTPVAEMVWSSSASRPNQTTTQFLFGVGVNYTADSYAMSVEMLIPGNKQTGSGLGVIAQFHLYFDDLMPNSLGKPIAAWFH